MSYAWIDHTAELELRLDASSESEIFEDALRALHELLNDGAPRDSETFELSLNSVDRAVLLAAWLDELIFRAEAHDLVPDAVERIELGAEGLRAQVRAHHGQPRHLVTGVAYDRLSFDVAEDHCGAMVVLEV